MNIFKWLLGMDKRGIKQKESYDQVEVEATGTRHICPNTEQVSDLMQKMWLIEEHLGISIERRSGFQVRDARTGEVKSRSGLGGLNVAAMQSPDKAIRR